MNSKNIRSSGRLFWRGKMKKIVIFIPSIQHGGLQRSLLEALNVVDTTRYDITVYAYNHYNPLSESLPKNVKVIIDTDKSHYIRKPISILLHIALLFAKVCRSKKNIEKYSKKIKDYIHKEKAKYPARKYFPQGVDVSISYSMDLCTQMALNVKADKHYVFFHSSNPNFHRDLSDKYFKHFDNIIAVGKNVQEMLKANFPAEREKIGLIKNYIDSDNVEKLADEYTVDTIADDNKKIIITSVIRVDKEKGADLIVSAAANLKKYGVPYKWYIVGDGSQRDEIETQIKINSLTNNVVITGYKKNPYPYIKACDIFVHPTYEESFGLAILEALILEKTIVSTETMGAKEVLNNGEFGVLVPINSEAIAVAVTEIVKNLKSGCSIQQTFKTNNEHHKITYKQKWETILDGGILS